MKRIMNLARLSLIAAGIMVLATLTACGASSSAGSGTGSGAAKKVSDEPKIGVAKIVAHPALDAL
ncbi:MAG TPA: hypothetical protein P5082_07820, partial [Treponema sp.]|nr:hypothetical protein [Treponema sp.]